VKNNSIANATRLRPIAQLVREHLAPAAIGIACAVPFAVMAQAAPDKKDGKETTLPEVKVTSPEEGYKKDSTSSATRTETPLRDIPQFINTVPQAVIRAQNATSLQDALRNVPGISYAAAEGGTQANQLFYLRGFPSGGDLFIDGVRDVGEYNRDLFATESVDVLKGPSALVFGRGSPGGLINQTTKIANLIPNKEVAVTFGNFDVKRLVADVNVKINEGTAARIVGLAEDSGAYRYPQDVERYGIAPSVRFGIGFPTEVTLSYYYLKTKDVTDYGQPTLSAAFTGGMAAMPPVSPENDYGYANYDFAHHETNIATARIDHRFNATTTLRNTTRWAKYERQLEATISTLANVDRLGRPVNTTTALEDLIVTRNHDGNRSRDNDDDVLLNQTDVTWKVNAGGMKHTVLGAVEFGRERLDRHNYLMDANPNLAGIQAPTSTTSFLNPDPNTVLSYTKVPNLRAVAQGDTVAALVQDQMEFNDQWKALLGLRWERYKSEARTDTIATGVTATGPFNKTDTYVSGRAGLIWQPTTTQSYYISAGNSYNPSGELGVYGATGTNLSAINQNLDPEENRGYEVGGTWDFRDGLQIRGAIFRNEKINARMVDPTGATVLEGKRRVNGIELQFAGAITPNWDIYSGIAFMDGKIVKAAANVGNEPLGVADFAGNVWTVYRLGGGWEVGGGIRGSSSFWLTDANNGEVPSYTVFDATVAYVRPSYEIRLNVSNIGDKTFYTGGYNNSPNRVLPGAPRTVALTLRYIF
jgi:catecholate siderophore receptor